MIESRSGYWWTSHDENKKVPGTLTRVDDHWQLDIVGMLPHYDQWTDGLSMVPQLTIFGVCLGKKFTLQGCHLQSSKGPGELKAGSQGESPRFDDRNYQQWLAWTMLSGGNHPDDELFSSAYFSLTGLAAWWPARELIAIKSIEDRAANADPIEIVVDDELTIEMHIGVAEKDSVRKFTVEKSVNILVRKKDGFTLDALITEVIQPLAGLLGMIIHRESNYFDCCLQPVDRNEIERWRNSDSYPVRVDPDVVADDDDDMRMMFPTFSPEDIDLRALIRNWIKLSPKTLVPRSVAKPQEHGGSLQIQVVEAINAAETLHRVLHDERREYPFTSKVSAALKECEGLDKKDREKVKSAVKLAEIPLKVRLAELANGIGEEFCLWFFNGQMSQWADVASVVRNALSHGYPTRHKMEQDVGALIGVYRCTIAVIRLRLFVEAGLPRDYPLVEVLIRDREYLALMKQSVANWEELLVRVHSVEQ